MPLFSPSISTKPFSSTIPALCFREGSRQTMDIESIRSMRYSELSHIFVNSLSGGKLECVTLDFPRCPIDKSCFLFPNAAAEDHRNCRHFVEAGLYSFLSSKASCQRLLFRQASIFFARIRSEPIIGKLLPRFGFIRVGPCRSFRSTAVSATVCVTLLFAPSRLERTEKNIGSIHLSLTTQRPRYRLCIHGSELLKALLLFDDANPCYVGWPVISLMPPEPAKALKKHVGGSQFGNQEIGV